MIDVSGHLRSIRREIGFVDHSKELVINSCGYQKFMTQDFYKTRRSGRLDYQLIYIEEGEGTYYLDGREEKHSAGELLLYRPGEPQIYYYLYKDAPLVYWIHFTGSKVQELLDQYGTRSGTLPPHSDLQDLFQEIILELQLHKFGFEAIVNASFHKMLALISRYQNESISPPQRDSLLDSLIIRLNQEYQEAWTVEEMARHCNLSEGYFAHYFKENMESSPMQYLTELRLSKAREFLMGSDMSVTNIAAAIGYNDSLYFSRVFKKHTGYAPTVYREEQHYLSTEQPRLDHTAD